METWYEVEKYESKVVEVSVERATEQRILLHHSDDPKGQWRAKHSDWSRYFSTRKEALEFLLGRAEDKLRDAERDVNEHKSTIQHARAELAKLKC